MRVPGSNAMLAAAAAAVAGCHAISAHARTGIVLVVLGQPLLERLPQGVGGWNTIIHGRIVCIAHHEAVEQQRLGLNVGLQQPKDNGAR